MPYITFINESKTVSIGIAVEAGTTILEAARTAGVIIESPCNALNICGKCRVRLPNPEDLRFIRATGEPELETGGTVFACRTRVFGPIEVMVKDYTAENLTLQIVDKGASFSYPKAPFITKKVSGENTQVYGGPMLLGTEEGDTEAFLYGLAVDIGTTTIVASLVDLHTGVELASESILNPQTRYAQDVLSRIHFAGQDEGLASLYQVFIESLHTLIAGMIRRTGINPRHIYEVVYSGNTAMLHLATKTDPFPLGQYPYTPRIWGGNHIAAAALEISQFGLIYLPPIISAFVGADITSGILVSRLDEVKGITLFIDVGTNGEIVLAKDGNVAAASTAAGPAFEGMNITCGMRANKGAVEAFCIDAEGEPSFRVIGGGPAIGICGSGLIDIAGELVRTGVIEASGRLVPPGTGNYGESLKRRIGEKDGKPAFFLTPDVYLAQQDIRQIQLAKGAIRTGIDMLLAHFGIPSQQVDQVEIAGSFGYHLNEKSLLNLGLLPGDFAGKVRFVGNTSMSGGIAFLLNAGFREKMSRVVKRIEQIELAGGADFEEIFIERLAF